MFERISVWGVAATVLAAVAPLAAQDDQGFAERERDLARQLAEQQESSAVRQRELAERQQAQQREQSAQQAEQQREYQVQQRQQAAQQREQSAQQQRDLARERQAQQRDLAAQQEQLARQTRELASELARAKAELQVSAAEIARLSAQLSGNAMGEAMRNVQNNQRLILLGQGSVLGINIEDADGGVRVRGVSPNGPAAAAGVAVGDTIVAIDGVELDDGGGTEALVARMRDVEPGQDVELRIRRGNEARVIVVEAGENAAQRFRFEPFYRAAPGAAPPAPAAPAAPLVIGPGGFTFGFGGRWSDVELVSLTPGLGEYFGTQEGLLVARAGNMGELGLRDGDVILEVGGRQPQSPEHATRIFASFEPGESVPLSIMRQRRRETVTITVPDDAGAWRRSGEQWFVRPERAERPERPERAEAPEPPERPLL